MAHWKIGRASCVLLGQCGKMFRRALRVVRHNQSVQQKKGPFCGKSCAGLYGTDVQNMRA
jgi:hypothetical protein